MSHANKLNFRLSEAEKLIISQYMHVENSTQISARTGILYFYYLIKIININLIPIIIITKINSYLKNLI